LENPFVVAYQFLNRGGPTMYALVFCSILMCAIIAERFYSLCRFSVDSAGLLFKIAPLIKDGNTPAALTVLRDAPGSLPRVLETGLLRHGQEKEEIESAMANTIQEQAPFLEGLVNILGTIAVIAPFLGLLGTITGLIKAFNQIALRGTTGPAVIATGIYEALYTTAAGLMIAIPAVIFYNYFKGRINSMIIDMEVSGNRLVEMMMLAKRGRPLPADLLPADGGSLPLKDASGAGAGQPEEKAGLAHD